MHFEFPCFAETITKILSKKAGLRAKISKIGINDFDWFIFPKKNRESFSISLIFEKKYTFGKIRKMEKDSGVFFSCFFYFRKWWTKRASVENWTRCARIGDLTYLPLYHVDFLICDVRFAICCLVLKNTTYMFGLSMK